MPVVELHTVRAIGVAGDAEAALVKGAVMFVAQRDQIVHVGRAAVRPVDDVVHIEPTTIVTARDAAAAVAVDDGASGAFGN